MTPCENRLRRFVDRPSTRLAVGKGHFGFSPKRPATVDDIDRLARTFNTSFEMNAIRMVQLATAPRAGAMTFGGHIKCATENWIIPSP
jgi:hypothetical protein